MNSRPEKHTLRWTPSGIAWEVRKSGETGVHVHRVKYQEVAISTADEPTEYAVEPFGGFFSVAPPITPDRFYWQGPQGEKCDLTHLVHSITSNFYWTFTRGTPVVAMFPRGTVGVLTVARANREPLETEVQVIGYDLSSESSLISVDFRPNDGKERARA